MAKAMPKCATQTKQGAKITTKDLTITVNNRKVKVPVYAVSVKGVEKYAVRRPLAPVDNSKYLALNDFEKAKNSSKPRKARKVAALVFSEAAQLLIPQVAKLSRKEIKPLVQEALKYKRANAKAIKAQLKVDAANRKIQKLQEKIAQLAVDTTK